MSQKIRLATESQLSAISGVYLTHQLPGSITDPAPTFGSPHISVNVVSDGAGGFELDDFYTWPGA